MWPFDVRETCTILHSECTFLDFGTLMNAKKVYFFNASSGDFLSVTDWLCVVSSLNPWIKEFAFNTKFFLVKTIFWLLRGKVFTEGLICDKRWKAGKLMGRKTAKKYILWAQTSSFLSPSIACFLNKRKGLCRAKHRHSLPIISLLSIYPEWFCFPCSAIRQSWHWVILFWIVLDKLYQ